MLCIVYHMMVYFLLCIVRESFAKKTLVCLFYMTELRLILRYTSQCCLDSDDLLCVQCDIKLSLVGQHSAIARVVKRPFAKNDSVRLSVCLSR